MVWNEFEKSNVYGTVSISLLSEGVNEIKIEKYWTKGSENFPEPG